MLIKDIIGREILDSRGNPTVEVDVILENGVIGRASVASGASTGSNEALELRDNDYRYNKKGVLKAVGHVNTIIKEKLIGMDAKDQEKIDQTMIQLDGTENKSQLGANAILGVSLACLKASAKDLNKELFEYVGTEYSLPVPMMNILNGGMHADNKLDFQEFMIIPQQSTFKERLRCGAEVFHALKKVLKSEGYSTNVGDEGGFAPNLNSNKEALEYIMKAISEAGYQARTDVNIALDVAASSFYDENTKTYLCDNKNITSQDLLNIYIELVNNYPIISIEDPFEESDFESFRILTEKIGDKVQIVGDDLFTTNVKLLQKGIDMKAGNAILLKANQIGSITEFLETIKLAKANGYKTIISHRSGETEETFIADLAVGLNLGQIKTGSLSRTDRNCKYNQLLRIEEKLTK